MVKLTVLYNLAPDADEDAFIRWRTTDHQKSNAARPGVLRTDFYVAEDTPLGPPKFRFITEAYYKDMEALEADFFNERSQKATAASIEEHDLRDFTVLVSTEYAASDTPDGDE